MQNKHYFFFSFLGIPTFGEGGGVKPVGPKSQLLPKICFGGFPYVLINRDFFSAAPFVQVHWAFQISSPRSLVWARSVLIALNAIARYKKGRKGSSGTSLFLCPPIRMCLSVFALWTWLHTAHSWQCTVDSAQCTLYSWHSFHSLTADWYSHSWHSQTAHQQRIQRAAQAQNKPQSRYRVAELF